MRDMLEGMTYRRGLYLQVAGLVLVAGIFGLARFFPLVDLIARTQHTVMQWGKWSAVCYPLLFALCNLLLLPGGILCVGAGFFFGLWWGFLIVLIGNAIGAAGAFIMTRSIARGWFLNRFGEKPTFRALGPAVEREGWKVIFLSQLHPLFPTSLINYLYGLTRVRFRTYMIWVLLGRAPGLFLYTYLGTLGQYGFNLARGKIHPRTMEYWTWGGAFIISAFLFVVLIRIAQQVIRQVEFENVGRGVVRREHMLETVL